MGEGMARQALEAENAAGGNRHGQRAIGQGEERKGPARGGAGGSQALVPTATNDGSQQSLLDLFNTPHRYGGSGGGVA